MFPAYFSDVYLASLKTLLYLQRPYSQPETLKLHQNFKILSPNPYPNLRDSWRVGLTAPKP